jgi:hypothetical protein
MPDFDPDERFDLPEDTDPDGVLRKLLESDGSEAVSDEPEDDVEESDS